LDTSQEGKLETKTKFELKEFFSELERASLDIPGSAGVPIIRPKENVSQPHFWPNTEIQRLLKKSEHVALGERRMLRLTNPGTPDWKYVTPTLSVSVQQILPGELAPPHRHTANAIRFFLKGKSYTTVEQDKCEMEPGDLVVTPGWEWHDYGNESSEPGVWLDALDLPIVQYLDACGYLKSLNEEMGYERYTEPKLPVTRAGISERARGATVGMRPFVEPEGTSKRTALIHYRWRSTYDALCRLAELPGDPYDDVIMEYVNPATGSSFYPTFACCIQMIRPGVRTKAHRQSSSGVYYVFEGSGETLINETRYEWSAGDLFVVPPSFWHEHANASGKPAILFSVHDFPLMKNLGLYREEAYPEEHQQAKGNQALG
jgi:gentisate 1,2-dioxygenase